MPVVQATLIQGYDAETKSRLAKSLTRAVRGVMAAPLEAVIVIFNEVHPTAYARGGVSRTPGPPLRPAVDVVRDFAAALAAGDATALAPHVAGDFAAKGHGVQPLALADYLQRAKGMAKHYEGFDEALTDDGSVVIAHGTVRGPQGDARCIDRFVVRANVVTEVTSWVAA